MFFVKRIQDADATYTDATDVPYRFVPCMVSGLAFYLAQKFNQQLVQQNEIVVRRRVSTSTSRRWFFN